MTIDYMVRVGSFRRGGCIFSAEDDAYIRERFPYSTAGDIADYLGCSDATVRKRARELGVVKREGYRSNDFQNRYVSNYKSGRYINFKKR